MATDVYYNGVHMHNVITREFSQTVVYDESDTDKLYSKFTIRVEGILHVQTGQAIDTIKTGPAWIGNQADEAPGVDVPKSHQWIRKRLSSPRGLFRMELDGQTLIRCTPATGNVNDADQNNGPHPRDVSIVHVAGYKVLKISFTIELAKLECDTNSPIAKGGVINNRWSIGETMDDKFFTTRTIRGRIRINNASEALHKAKSLVVPGLEDGFKRVSIDFDVDRTGLNANYTIIDQQIHTAAPWPAIKIECEHTESTVGPIEVYSDITVRLTGSPEADKRDMLTQAMRILSLRLGHDLGNKNKQWIPVSASLTDHIGETNVVIARLRAKRLSEELTAALGNLKKDIIGKPLALPPLLDHLYDPRKSREPAIYGYNPHTDGERDGESNDAALVILRCYLQQPCKDPHGQQYKPSKGETPDPNPDYPPKITGTQYPSELPDGQSDLLSESAKEAIYTLCRQTSRYIFVDARTQMPIARATGSVTGSDASTVFQLARQQCRREIHLEVERVGDRPELPEPVETYTDGSLKGIRLRYWDKSYPPTLTNDKRQKHWRMDAYYLYALNRQPTASETTRIGVLPATSFVQSALALTRSAVYQEKLAP